MTLAEAFWISPGGNIIPVGTRHIDLVIRHPEKFGLDKKSIDDVYEKHGEGIGVEGKARDEIFIKIVKKGWMRLRYNSRASSWTAQVDTLNKKKKDYLWSWIDGMLDGKYGKPVSKSTELVVIDLNLKIQYRDNFQKAHENFFEGKNTSTTKLTLIEDYEEEVLLTETSLSRVWKHVTSDKSLAIMTAFRNEYTLIENNARNKELSNLVRDAGYGFIWLDGHWVENKGTEKEKDVSERSLFIIGNENDDDKLFNLVKKWIKKYNQDAAVVKKSKSKDIFLIFQDGKTVPLGRWVPGKVAQAYSKMRNGKTFVFETAWTQGGVMSHWKNFYTQKSQIVLEKLDSALGISYDNT